MAARSHRRAQPTGDQGDGGARVLLCMWRRTVRLLRAAVEVCDERLERQGCASRACLVKAPRYCFTDM